MRLSEQIEILLDEIESDPERELSEKEKVIVDVVEATTLIEEDGLHAFWFSSLSEELVIKALDEIGAYEIVDLVQSSQWCKSSAEDRGDFSETEEGHLSGIEEELMPKIDDILELIEDYLEE